MALVSKPSKIAPEAVAPESTLHPAFYPPLLPDYVPTIDELLANAPCQVRRRATRRMRPR